MRIPLLFFSSVVVPALDRANHALSTSYQKELKSMTQQVTRSCHFLARQCEPQDEHRYPPCVPSDADTKLAIILWTNLRVQQTWLPISEQKK
eukprot:2116420-Amphidinium_carterae.1